MKKILAVVLLATTFNANSQTVMDKIKTGTYNKDEHPQQYTLPATITEEEYKYISKGLVDDLNKGKDTKQGYKFEAVQDQLAIITGLFDNTNYYLIKCFRSNDQHPFALAIKSSANNVAKFVVCIPPGTASASINATAKTEFFSKFTTITSTHLLFSTLQILCSTY